MHEMGIVLNVVREAEIQAKQYSVEKIGRLTLQIGELSGVEGGYVRACWPAAIENTILDGAELILEGVVGLVTCKSCGCVYRALEHLTNNFPECPDCHSSQWELKQGRDVVIKEIGVYD